MSQDENFEAVAKRADTTVASFDDANAGFLHKFHHLLHTTPAIVPLIVLTASIITFGLLLGSKFFSPCADIDFTTGANCRHHRRRPKFGHSDRWH